MNLGRIFEPAAGGQLKALSAALAKSSPDLRKTTG
jgi:hypothetical protein